MQYYRVETLDPTDDGREFVWRCVVARCGKWSLRRVVRRLYGEGYDRCAIQITRYDLYTAEQLRADDEHIAAVRARRRAEYERAKAGQGELF